MPYIQQTDRQIYDSKINELGSLLENSDNYAGDLNYVITSLIQSSIKNTKKNYFLYNEIIGVLECSKLEFYRRAVTPYEEEKIIQNGDCY